MKLGELLPGERPLMIEAHQTLLGNCGVEPESLAKAKQRATQILLGNGGER